jgi:hypothetical protein
MVAEEQVSVATTSPIRFGMAAWQFAPDDTLLFDAQVVMTGGVVSTTFTVRVAVAVFVPSVAE